jgi:hypothetical protein
MCPRLAYGNAEARQTSESVEQGSAVEHKSLNFGIRLPRELIERTDARAQLEDLTRTQVIRRALREHLAKPAPGEADAEQHKEAA